MKTPSFWKTYNLVSTLLLPCAWGYGIASAHKQRAAAKTAASLSRPLICIGNLVAGGAGKTPTAIAIGALLKQKNVNAYFLSRGYNGELAGPLLVNPRVHTAREVGDEPLLLAATLPTVIAKDKLAGATFAIEHGADAIVMDDGLQNHSMIKALSLLVIDGQYGFGNGRLLPAGPLRESPASGFAHAHAALVINPSEATPKIPPSLPVLTAAIRPAEPAYALKGKDVLAFCGIAHPGKFFATIGDTGANIVHTVVFPDHYLYRDRDIKKLVDKARIAGATLVTTAKDAVRLSPDWRPLVTVIDITLRFDQPEQLDALLNNALKQTW